MARMKLGRDLGWLSYRSWETVEDGKVWHHIEAKPKRWYALRPSFWLFAVRHLRLSPYKAQPLENEE
jgi:hypothetical protein